MTESPITIRTGSKDDLVSLAQEYLKRRSREYFGESPINTTASLWDNQRQHEFWDQRLNTSDAEK